MKLPRQAVIALLLVLVAICIHPLPGPAQLEGAPAKIHPDVLFALQEDAEVAVIVSLAPSETSLGDGLTVTDVAQSTSAAQASVLSALGPEDFTVVRRYSVVPALAGYVTASGVQVLAGHAEVAGVGIDLQMDTMMEQSVPLVRAHAAYTQGLDGSGVNVAVFDTGIDPDHPDLVDSLIGEVCFLPFWRDRCPGEPDYAPGAPFPPDPEHPAKDDAGHGTHVSGIITSDGQVAPLGVAPGANVFAFKVGSFGLIADPFNMSGVLDALNCMIDPECLSDFEFDLINMSFGTCCYETSAECDAEWSSMTWAFETVRSLGTVAFAASGNLGTWTDGRTAMAYPACLSSVVSVAAVYDADVGPRTCDSATAPDQVTCFSNVSDDLDLLAPGSETTSTWPTYPTYREIYGTPPCPPYQPTGGTYTCSGTSAASPHAVGVAALVKQARPDITPDELVQILKNTGVPVTDDYDPQHVRTIPRVDAQAAALAVGAIDSSGVYHVLEILAPAGEDPPVPGSYHHCLAHVDRGVNDLTARVYCYVDTPGVPVNPQAGPESGDGFPGVPPPEPYGDVDDVHAVLTGSVDEGQSTVTLSGCFENRDGQAALGNVYVEWAQPNTPSGEGTVTVWTDQHHDDCLNGTPHGSSMSGVLQSVRLADEAAGHDFDHDNCPDVNELSDNQQQGGLRDPFNHWDYFNPTHDGENRVDDILAVVNNYFIDKGNPDYTKETDRTAVIGANSWNLNRPNGLTRVEDMQAAVKSYFHDCSGGDWIDDDTYPK